MRRAGATGVPALVLVTALLTACAGPGTDPRADPGPAGDALVAAGVDGRAAPGRPAPRSWASAIQAPHHQTDRDVGAAGIASGLLALADVTTDPVARTRYLDAARGAAEFLLAAPRGTPGRFPDYVDGAQVADAAYTSFDDGAAGIADLLWQMGERTGDARYRAGALAGVRWLLSRAEGADGLPCPQRCRWAWTDDGAPSYRNGMGEGQAGIVYALSVFAERTGDPALTAHAVGGAAYLESRLDDDGGLPESASEPARNTGYLSGAAGASFVFLRMFQAPGDPRWRRDAERTLAFLDDNAVTTDDGRAWPIMVDDGDDAAGDDPHRATGMEEGAAGIGWVSLQAWRLLGGDEHRQRARDAGRWLTATALDESGGKAWPEYEGASVVHVGTNSGAAGIGWFLHDLALATGDAEAAATAEGARTWLLAAARPEGDWSGSRHDGQWQLAGEPSWHWGSAGVLGFLARMRGWPVDSPGMQPALVPVERD